VFEGGDVYIGDFAGGPNTWISSGSIRMRSGYVDRILMQSESGGSASIRIGEYAVGKTNVLITDSAIKLRVYGTDSISMSTTGEIMATNKITAGTGNNIGRLDGSDALWRIYAGHSTPASAPFRVDQSGALTATNATLTGTLNAGSGAVIVGDTGIEIASGLFDVNQIRFMIGSTRMAYINHNTTDTAKLLMVSGGNSSFGDYGQIYMQANFSGGSFPSELVLTSGSSSDTPYATITGGLVVGIGTNTADFDTTGHLVLSGTAKPWEDLRIEPVARASGTGAPTFEKWYDDAAGTSKGVWLYSFTNETVAGNEKEVHFSMQMPHAWDGGPISMHVHWTPAATQNATDVVWGLEYVWKDIGEVFGDTTIVYSSTTLAPDDANITAGKHYISEFIDLVPGTSANGLSSILIGRLFRNSSSATDNYTDKVGLLYIDAHYQMNSLGSNDEYVK
jgi:hypothetical protein